MRCFNDPELSFGLWDDIEQLHGTANILFDFIDRPESLNAIAERFTEVRLAELDILEAKGLPGYGIAIADFEETLAATRANGCPVELTLKDISTCRYDPRRLWEWCDIADRMVRA